jgi:high affinity Mn2+ porin
VEPKLKNHLQTAGVTAALACVATTLPAAEVSTNSATDPVAPIPNKTQPAVENSDASKPENWNWHAQNTDIVQGYPEFPADYAGANSLPNGGETRETVSADLMAGVRLWQGAEAHVDGLMWQGYGLGHTLGIEAFPNGEAYRVGTTVPNVNLARAFIRQTINLGGDEEAIDDDPLHLAGAQEVSHLTLTLGKISLIDIFDNNTYANDPRTQFMNWAFVANEAWDYPADSLGYTTGLAAELYEPHWTARYGFFQVPRSSNGLAQDQRYLAAWGMVTELERRYSILNHPGVIRFLAYLNRANMGSYQDAINNFNGGGSIDITQTRANRFKYGFGLNWEQEITENIGIFSRLGWSDGHTEAWAYTDVDRSASLGLSVKGGAWHRADDTFGLAGVISGITPMHQQFFADGGTGILGGDGALNYSWEKTLETYYDFKIWKTIHAALDYQFIADPAFNADRGPISVFGARLHWEF